MVKGNFAPEKREIPDNVAEIDLLIQDTNLKISRYQFLLLRCKQALAEAKKAKRFVPQEAQTWERPEE